MSLSGTVWQRVLVTGAKGFVGQHFVSALYRRGFEGELTLCGGPEHAGDGIALDVRDLASVMKVVEQVRPTAIVHLAAIAAVTAANRDSRQAWDVNLGGTLNIVDAMKAHAPGARLLFISSAEVYGRTFLDHDLVDESLPMRPVNPYAASKAAADILVRQSAYSGLDTVIARPFNHTGPGQSEAFVVPAFAAQVARIEAGLQPSTIRVGNLDDERDFLDVRDVVDAYIAMLDSQASVSIEIEVDVSRLRPTPIPRVVGDASNAHDRLGWVPAKDIYACFTDILQECRARVAASTAA